MPDTTAEAALPVLNGLREAFAHITHQAEACEFSATFSCGVADYPQYEDGAALNDAADKALYVAKESGRNQVKLHS